jgi:hypothetical protein
MAMVLSIEQESTRRISMPIIFFVQDKMDSMHLAIFFSSFFATITTLSSIHLGQFLAG